jgi:5-methylcytosine-specific restriction endonuclease McrA
MNDILDCDKAGMWSMNLYKTTRWKRKRKIILKRDEYMCRECRRYGKTTAASTVHHVIPVEEQPKLAFVNENLLSLCDPCHDAMHDRNNDVLTELGRQWVDRLGLNEGIAEKSGS